MSKNCWGVGAYIFDNSYIDEDDAEGYHSKVCQLWLKSMNSRATTKFKPSISDSFCEQEPLVYSQNIKLPEKQCTRVSSTKKRKSDLPCAEEFFKIPSIPPVHRTDLKKRSVNSRLAEKPTSNVLLETVISGDDKIIESASAHPSAYCPDLHDKSTQMKTTTQNAQKLDEIFLPRNFLGKSLPKTSFRNNKADKLDKQFRVNPSQAQGSLDLFGNLTIPSQSRASLASIPRRYVKTRTVELKSRNGNVPEILNISKQRQSRQKPTIDPTAAIPLIKNYAASLEPPRKNEPIVPPQNKRVNHEHPGVSPIVVPAVSQADEGRMVANHFHNCRYMKIMYVK